MTQLSLVGTGGTSREPRQLGPIRSCVAGQSSVGGTVSVTVTFVSQLRLSELPSSSVAVNVTVVSPNG